MTRSSTPRSSILDPLFGRQPPVELLLHPVTVTALAIMIVNDGWLRGAYPGWLPGKISDFAAVLAYPGLISALWGLGAMALDGLVAGSTRRSASGQPALRGVDYSLGPTVILGSAILTGAILAGINLWTPFRDGYLSLLRHLDVFGWFGPFHYTMDPSDLLGLVLLPVVWLVGRRLLARIPAGRLRAVHREATRHTTRDAVLTAVDRGLADVRRALGRDPTSPQNATLNVVRDLMVEGALQEAALRNRPEPDVAFDPVQHYHRVVQALENHRNRGSNP